MFVMVVFAEGSAHAGGVAPINMGCIACLSVRIRYIIIGG